MDFRSILAILSLALSVLIGLSLARSGQEEAANDGNGKIKIGNPQC